MKVFRPIGSNVTVSVSTSSATAAVSVSNPVSSASKRVIRIVNGSDLAAGPITMFVRTGAGSQTATSASLPLMAADTIILPYPDDHTNVGIIATGSSTAYAQAGVMDDC